MLDFGGGHGGFYVSKHIASSHHLMLDIDSRTNPTC
jgi:hypothetical protein